tara:strand:- start:231 stop:440 length:210 start_codon:yes stop_codon:yes gene_type:complete
MAFKMRGFSPFTQKNELEIERQKKISSVDAKIEALEEQVFNEEISQQEYDRLIKPLRTKEKEVKKPLKK